MENRSQKKADPPQYLHFLNCGKPRVLDYPQEFSRYLSDTHGTTEILRLEAHVEKLRWIYF